MYKKSSSGGIEQVAAGTRKGSGRGRTNLLKQVKKTRSARDCWVDFCNLKQREKNRKKEAMNQQKTLVT
jgi:hypothetical protein